MISSIQIAEMTGRQNKNTMQSIRNSVLVPGVDYTEHGPESRRTHMELTDTAALFTIISFNDSVSNSVGLQMMKQNARETTLDKREISLLERELDATQSPTGAPAKAIKIECPFHGFSVNYQYTAVGSRFIKSDAYTKWTREAIQYLNDTYRQDHSVDLRAPMALKLHFCKAHRFDTDGLIKSITDRFADVYLGGNDANIVEFHATSEDVSGIAAGSITLEVYNV